MAKIKQVFICTECGYESPKWNGQCPQCKEWSTMEEQTVVQGSKTEIHSSRKVEVKTLSEIQTGSEIRFSTGLKELDRVLGGGLVEGSLTLVGGDPGIGKSTLLLQICQYLGQEKKVLYVSGEESMGQIKLRAERLNVLSSNLFLACETNVETILDTCNTNAPDVLIIDSVQTMMSDRVSSAPGTVTCEMVKTMNKDAIIFACANPTPEIFPEDAKAGGAAVIATGRSDFPNQINNVLAFPGIFRGTFDVRASDINEEMKMAAAMAIAGLISDEELTADYIIPAAFDERVGGAVAAAVAEAARKTGVARI